MVRISIPNLPPSTGPRILSGLSVAPVADAAVHLGDFLSAGGGKTLAITGAGVSVDSGIRAYRGKEGAYSNPNYKCVVCSSERSERVMLMVDRFSMASSLRTLPVGKCSGMSAPLHELIADAPENDVRDAELNKY